MGQGMRWVWGLVLGAECCCRAVHAAEFERPTLAEAESVLADLSWVETALNERAVLLGQETLPVPSVNDYLLLKQFCANLSSQFVDQELAGSDGDFTSYLDNHAGYLPKWGPVKLTERLELPPDYFSCAPPPLWLGTGVSTAAQWTVADYGHQGLQRAIRRLVWTQPRTGWDRPEGALNDMHIGYESNLSWEELKQRCEENVGASYSDSGGAFAWTWGYCSVVEGQPDSYGIVYDRLWNDLTVPNLSTQKAHAVDLYVKYEIWGNPYLPNIKIFDNHGMPQIQQGFDLIARIGNGYDERVSIRLGDLGGRPLNWCDQPPPGVFSIRGFQVTAIPVVARWDVPGGLTP